MKEIIEAAKSQVDEIVKKSHERYHRERYLSFYESENGYTCAWVQDGHVPIGKSIDFGKLSLTKSRALQIIEKEEEEFWI
jgi:hypothetical protein